MVLRVAAKAVITNARGEVLILREASTDTENTRIGQYQIPGGRIEIGERFVEGLNREIAEETGLAVKQIIRPLYVDEWHPVIKGVEHQIVGVFMLVLAEEGEVNLSNEHDTALWIKPEEWAQYPIMEQDTRAIQAYVLTK